MARPEGSDPFTVHRARRGQARGVVAYAISGGPLPEWSILRCYNLASVHRTLRVTPAIEARLADHVGAIEEIVALP
jgi:hypothetical protein